MDRRWPEGEAPVEVVSRARAALREVLELDAATGDRAPQRSRHVALVTHGRFNKIVLTALLGRGLARCGEITQGNCCINVLDIDPSAPFDDATPATEIALNLVEHLAHIVSV